MKRGRVVGTVSSAIGAIALAGVGLAGAAGGFGVVPSPSPPGSSLAGVGFVTAADGWVVGGFKGPNRHDGLAPLTEHWDGTAFTVVSAPDTQFNDDTLVGVGGIASNDVWAVGQRKRTGFKSPVTPLVLHWDGSAWSVVPTPALGFTRYSLAAVSAISSNDVWAVGTTIGGTLAEHWDGSAWSVVPTPSPAGSSSSSLLAVSARASNDVWAVGASSSLAGTSVTASTLVEHWDGNAWSVVPSPNVPPQAPGVAVQDLLTGVVALNATNAWASGYSIDVASGSFLPDRTVIEHWNGSAWSIVKSPNPRTHNTLSAIGAIGANNVWAVGNGWTPVSTGVPVAVPELLHWTNGAWTSVAPPPNVGASDNILDSIATVSGTVWAAGTAGGVGTLVLRNP